MRFIPFILLIAFFTKARADVRTFTNNKGTQLQAELIEVNGDKVVLKIRGQNYPVPINTLSKDDQNYIEDWKQSSGDAAPEVNWDGEWPRLISVGQNVKEDIEIIAESEEGYIYASKHYKFHSNVKLKTSLVRRFVLLFEATNQYMRELPLGMSKPFQEKRFPIYLFETRQQYEAAGGLPNSGGVYISGPNRDDVLIPLESLGVIKRSSGFSIDYDKENKTISHEIAHQLTDRAYFAPGARGWFSEGLAEYIALSGYRSGKFNVDDINKIKKYVTAFGDDNRGRNLGEEISVPNFKAFANQSYDSFRANGNLNYGVSALLVYYFFHMDGEKDAANIKSFLKALQEGKRANEALEALLNGRTYAELEEQITKSWRGRGIKINWRS